MAYFGLVIAASILPAFLASSVSWMARWQMLIAAVGAFVSLLLAYISYFKIQAVCLVCSTVHAISVVNFIWTLVGFMKVRNQPQTVAEGGFVKLLAVCLALGVPPLLAGAILPLVSSTLGVSTESPGKSDIPEATATPFPAEWVQFSVSNYVGQGEDYRKGSDQAKVVVHMFSDLECPHCKITAEAIESAQSAVGADQVLFVYRNYPLSNKCNANIGGEGHSHACDLAMALRCAGSQRKEAFWEYKDWAFSGIEMSPEERQRTFTLEGMRAHAEKLKLDPARFEACLRDKIELPKIQADIDIGKKMGLTGTPLVVINGRTYSGDRTPQALTRAMREALASK
jgi:protein-disulfide isomerase